MRNMEKKQYICPEITTVQLALRTSLLILSNGDTITFPDDLSSEGGDGSDAASRRSSIWDDEL
jgi:hypothetical protein